MTVIISHSKDGGNHGRKARLRSREFTREQERVPTAQPHKATWKTKLRDIFGRAKDNQPMPSQQTPTSVRQPTSEPYRPQHTPNTSPQHDSAMSSEFNLEAQRKIAMEHTVVPNKGKEHEQSRHYDGPGLEQ